MRRVPLGDSSPAKSFRPLSSALLTVCAVLCVLCGACRATNDATQENQSQRTENGITNERVAGAPGGRLSYRLTSPPKTFNYLIAEDEATILVSFYLIGGRLVEFNHDTSSYVPALAESWRVGDDGRTVELVLREGVRFSDGRPITADDVLFTLRAIYDRRTASPIFATSLLVGERRIEATALDARRVRFTFPEAVASVESYLSNIAVVPRHILESKLDAGTIRDAYTVTTAPQEIVTAGAFIVRESVPGERISLARNPYYWKRDERNTPLPYLEELRLEVISDANVAFVQFRNNALDILDRMRTSDFAALKSAQPQNVQASAIQAYDLGPGLNTDYLWFNLNPESDVPPSNAIKLGWFSDIRFRRAIALAIDREGIAKNVLQSLATPLNGIVSPGNRAWVAGDISPLKYNLDSARAMLAEAGFTLRETNGLNELFDSSGNRIRWTIIAPVENAARVAMATAIQEDLTRLGMDVTVAPVEFAELTRRWSKSKDYDAVLLGASVSEPDPSSYTNLLRSSSPGHVWHPGQTAPATDWERRLDDTLDRLERERNVEARRALFRDVQHIITEQMPVVPIVARHITVGVSSRIGNYRPARVFPFSLWNIEELFVRL